MNSNKEINVGDEAPDFTLPDQRHMPVSLRDFKNKKSVVLFFYPKDYSPICTLEAIAFREAYEKLEGAGAEVIGISADSPEVHTSFCDFLKLPFRLLTDRGHQVRDRYGAKSILGLKASRVTYVIDDSGIVRGRYAAALASKEHVKEALRILQSGHGVVADPAFV